MDPRTRAELAQALRRQRAVLPRQFFDAEADLRSIAEDREPELEERAQAERAARVLVNLDDRSLREIGEIHAALERMIAGTYGRCLGCGRAIRLDRLRAVPTAAFCVDCAREEETSRGAPAAREPRQLGGLPADLGQLLDREIQEALRELIREDGRVAGLRAARSPAAGGGMRWTSRSRRSTLLCSPSGTPSSKSGSRGWPSAIPG